MEVHGGPGTKLISDTLADPRGQSQGGTSLVLVVRVIDFLFGEGICVFQGYFFNFFVFRASERRWNDFGLFCDMASPVGLEDVGQLVPIKPSRICGPLKSGLLS